MGMEMEAFALIHFRESKENKLFLVKRRIYPRSFTFSFFSCASTNDFSSISINSGVHALVVTASLMPEAYL